MFKLILLFTGIFLITSCRKDKVIPKDNLKTDFLVIGHAYGNPLVYKLSLYEKLIPTLASFSTFIKPDKYIFTGDVVAKPTQENWTNVLNQFDSLNINYWIAPGNHDLGSDYFLNHIQDKPFFSYRSKSNLFLILNTNFPGWTVDQDQIDLIQAELGNLNSIQNIFVFSHQVWWAKTADSPYNMEEIETNAYYLINGPTSFWTDAFPIFENTNIATYFFAGDVGALDFRTAYNEQHFENFHFYASGVGGGIDDNILYIKTYDSGKVVIEKFNF